MPSDWRAACPASAAPTSARLGEAVSVTGARGCWPQGAVIFSEPGRRRLEWVAPAAGGLAMRRRGARVPRGSRVSGIRQRGGTTDNSSCGWESGCILHDSSPNEASRPLARGPCRVGLSTARTSGRECAAPGRGEAAAGRAVRPSAEHGRPEVRLIDVSPAPGSSFQHEAKRRGPKGGVESWSLARALACGHLGARGRGSLTSGQAG